jgi:hypothetical protein
MEFAECMTFGNIEIFAFVQRLSTLVQHPLVVD